MDFGKAFTYQFEAEDWWKKLLLTGLIALIPVVGMLYVIGWMMEVAGRFAKASEGESVLLPDVDFGGFLGAGFKGVIVSLVYALPSVIVMLPLAVIMPVSINTMDDPTVVVALAGICCGGLGILFVHKFSDSCSYKRDKNTNIFKLIKHLPQEDR